MRVLHAIPGAARPPAPRRLRAWWFAIRPPTLAIALSPVIAGTGIAASTHQVQWLAALIAAAAAVLIQIGTNLQNDVGDFERGADAVARFGPPRATTLGWLDPAEVRRGVTLAFALAFALGSVLVWQGGWPILIVGLASVSAGLAYTSGARPIAYTGWGDFFVLLFFGLVGVGGSFYLQTATLAWSAAMAGLIVGMPASAVLVVNNYRDLDSDRKTGKRTLVAAHGPRFARVEYAVLMFAPFTLLPAYGALQGALAAALPASILPWAVILVRRFRSEPRGPGLNLLLKQTVRFQFVLGILVGVSAAL